MMDTKRTTWIWLRKFWWWLRGRRMVVGIDRGYGSYTSEIAGYFDKNNTLHIVLARVVKDEAIEGGKG